MRVRSITAGAVVAGLLAVACSGGSATTSDRPSFEVLQPLPAGDPLPEAELAVLGGDGATLSTEDLIGTPAVINFWATWCAFCVEEMPDFQAVHEEVGASVRFVGVDREDVADKALELAQLTGVTYDLVEDPTGDFFRALQGRGMPTTVLVDAQGTVRYRHAGPLSAEQLRQLLAEHLDV